MPNRNTNNAIKIHRVLLDVVTRVVHSWLEDFIIKLEPTNPAKIANILETAYTTRNPFLNVIKQKLEKYLTENQNIFPRNLRIFDISGCFSLAKQLDIQRTMITEYDHLDKLRIIRNKYYGHLTFLEINEVEFENILSQLREIVDLLSLNDELKRRNRQKIDEILKTCIVTQRELDLYDLTIKTLISEKEDLHDIKKEIENLIHHQNSESLQLKEDLLEELRKSLKKTASIEIMEKISDIFSRKFEDNEIFKEMFKHIDMSLDTVLTDISHLKMDSELIKSDLRDIKANSIFPDLTKIIASNLPNEICNFTARETSLDEIADIFKTGQFVAISAFAGTGKTTLANKYGHLIKNVEKLAVVRWLKAETQDKFKNDYMSLAKEFNIKNKSTNVTVNELNAKLMELTENGNRKVLLLLDNLEKYEDIQDFINDNLPSRVKVLITTRNCELNFSKIRYIKLRPFNRDEAIEFIRKSSVKKIANSQDAMESLLKTIGLDHQGHFEIIPIKLNLAVAYIKKSYVSRIEEDLKRLKFDSFWASLIENVREKSESAFAMLKYVSYLDADFSMIDFLSILFSDDQECVNESIDVLKELSLVELTSHEIKDHLIENNRLVKEIVNDIYGLKMHRLVQKEVRDYIMMKQDKNAILEELLVKFDLYFDDKSYLYSVEQARVKEKSAFFSNRFDIQHRVHKQNMILSFLKLFENQNALVGLECNYSIRRKIALFNLIGRDYAGSITIFRDSYRLFTRSTFLPDPNIKTLIYKCAADLELPELFIGLAKIGKIIDEIVIDVFQCKLLELLEKKYANFLDFLDKLWERIKDTQCDRWYKGFVLNLIYRKRFNIEPFICVSEWVNVARLFLKEEIRPRQFSYKYKNALSKYRFAYRINYEYDTESYLINVFHSEPQWPRRKQKVNSHDRSLGGCLNNLTKILRVHSYYLNILVKEPSYLMMSQREYTLIIKCLRIILESLLKDSEKKNDILEKFDAIENISVYDLEEVDGAIIELFKFLSPYHRKDHIFFPASTIY